MTRENQALIVIYDEAGKAVEVRLDREQETVWLTQRLMSELFDKHVRTANEDVLNVYSEGESERDSTIRHFRIVRQEGAREVSRSIEYVGWGEERTPTLMWPNDCVGVRKLTQTYRERGCEENAGPVGAINTLSRWMQQMRNEGQSTADACTRWDITADKAVPNATIMEEEEVT